MNLLLNHSRSLTLMKGSSLKPAPQAIAKQQGDPNDWNIGVENWMKSKIKETKQNKPHWNDKWHEHGLKRSPDKDSPKLHQSKGGANSTKGPCWMPKSHQSLSVFPIVSFCSVICPSPFCTSTKESFGRLIASKVEPLDANEQWTIGHFYS